MQIGRELVPKAAKPVAQIVHTLCKQDISRSRGLLLFALSIALAAAKMAPMAPDSVDGTSLRLCLQVTRLKSQQEPLKDVIQNLFEIQSSVHGYLGPETQQVLVHKMYSQPHPPHPCKENPSILTSHRPNLQPPTNLLPLRPLRDRVYPSHQTTSGNHRLRRPRPQSRYLYP